MKNKLLPFLAGAALAAVAATSASAGTLDTIKSKGFVQCGVNTGQPGFGAPDAKGVYSGFDVDYCKAVAAAVFGSVTADNGHAFATVHVKSYVLQGVEGFAVGLLAAEPVGNMGTQ